MVRQFSGQFTIELYVKYAECAIEHGTIDEAQPSNYNRNEVEVEEADNEGFHEEDDDKEDDGDDYKDECCHDHFHLLIIILNQLQ